ncbi:MAG: DUF1800 domain-containing protein [Acidobacteria bacterium]|nr:MAG: DUF1800 domain-containing protein [Acidobacteriota bacterium]PYU73976.1 MAG: DUF1800 domain-containing protein [Acidobacteriota bacterium]
MRLEERPASSFFQRIPAISATPRSFLAAILSVTCVLSLTVELPASAAIPAVAKEKKPKADPALKGLPITELSPDEAILHALNRLAYGPRPGDVERVQQMGLAKWIEQQLNPNSIDDRAMEARLQDYPTLRMSTAKLIDEYPQPKQAEKQAQQVQAQARQERRRSDAAVIVVEKDTQNAPEQPANSEAPAMTSASAPQPWPDNPSAAAPMKQPAQGKAATNGTGRRDVLGGGDPNNVPRAIADDSKRPQRVVAELGMAKVTRAIYSERQLQQVMNDFWFNHFNVFAGKGEDRYYLTSYERDVIQPHAFGKFKDLVTATAKSPAMLFYLDNFLSVDPRAAQRQAAERAMRQQRRRGGFGWPPRPTANPQQPPKKNDRGLNENYGRELMELHTLGVDGGYTQKDVTEVARCFTGWTIDKPRQYADFKFDDRLHDPDTKIVLGKKIHAGGMKDGEQLIDMLAHHPSTAKFISTKLARRFVSDNPPPALVSRLAETFQSSDGDIHAVLKTMIWSPEFWSRESYRAKIKTPFELVVSAVRALGTDVDTPMPLVQWVARIGEPLYQCQPPTGYADKAEAWVNTGALLNRLNYSLALAGNKMRGARTDVTSLLGVDSSADPKTALDRAVRVFLGGQAGPTTVETLEKQLDNPQVLQAKLDDPRKQVDLGVVAGLVLGAPEFQRR